MAVESQGDRGSDRLGASQRAEGQRTAAARPANLPAGNGQASRRLGRRRVAGPARDSVAANDDAPSIGGLIYALQQRPSSAPFRLATIASGVWLVVSLLIAWGLLAPVVRTSSGLAATLLHPNVIIALCVAALPVALFWFLALLMWRTQELRLMSSAMSEVAVRLVEPDRMAEQSIAALGQSVRRQVAAMNDAISRAIGRAGELEVLVQNEVSALERSYDDNEHRIRDLIDELVSEREALANNSDRVSEELRGVGSQISESIWAAGAAVSNQLSERGNALHSSVSMMSQRIGSELPQLLEKLSQEQARLSLVVEGATSNLDQLQTALSDRTSEMDAALGIRTKQLQSMLQQYSTTIDTAIADHAETLGSRLNQLTTAIENTNLHIENVLTGRTDALDAALVERTKAIDTAFATRMAEIDESIERSSAAVEGAISRGLRAVEAAVAQGASVVDGAIGNRVDVLRAALERHATAVDTTLRQQSDQLQSAVMHGVDSLRRDAEAVSQQSSQTIGNMSMQARMLREVSEGVLGQLGGLLERFDQQTRSVAQVAVSLEGSQGRLAQTTRDLNSQFTSLSKDINQMTSTVGSHLTTLPVAARESATSVRAALQDQIKALDSLTLIAREQRSARGITPPEGQSSTLRPRTDLPALPVPPRTAPAQLPSSALVSSGRDGWSLGDLLARASKDEAEQQATSAASLSPAGEAARRASPQPSPAGGLDLGNIATALDPSLAANLWMRHRSGERGVFARQVYSAEGQATFDQIRERAQVDAGFRNMIERYLTDFERVLRDADQRDPSGGIALGHVQADTGRVYLLLAHATGRLGS